MPERIRGERLEAEMQWSLEIGMAALRIREEQHILLVDGESEPTTIHLARVSAIELPRSLFGRVSTANLICDEPAGTLRIRAHGRGERQRLREMLVRLSDLAVEARLISVLDAIAPTD